MGNKKGQSYQLALFIVLEMCLEDGNVPIDAPSPFCSVHRVFSVPFNPLCVLQDLNGFSMTRPRPVTFDLVRRKIDVTHGPEILNPSAIDGDRFVVQHGSTFSGSGETGSRCLFHIVAPPGKPAVRTGPTAHHVNPRGPVSEFH